MKTSKRKGKQVHAPNSRPMRGGLLSTIASAFRLRQAVLGETADVAEGTARHALIDHHDVGRGRHVSLVRALIDGLFTNDYLVGRGLSPHDATRHNDQVTQALEVILDAWDRLAVLHNVTPEKLERVESVVGPYGPLGAELPIRIAAYHARYGFLHPLRSDLGSWIRAPRIKGWWTGVGLRVRKPFALGALHGAGELHRRTVRDLRDGRKLPKEQTVKPLATRLALHGVRARDDTSDVSAAELEFELRVAVAVAEHRALATLAVDGSNGGDLLLRAFHRILADAPGVMLDDLLVRGTHSGAFPNVMRRLPDVLAALAIESTELGRVAPKDADPLAAFGRIVEGHRQQAHHLLSLDQTAGADGPEKRFAEQLEHFAAIANAVATGQTNPVPAPRAELPAELDADRLCLEAIAPWIKLSIEEREQRFREAVRLCPHLAHAHRSLAAHLLSTGRLGEARDEYRRALELNPAHVAGRETLVLIAAHFNDHDDVLSLTAEAQSSVTLRSARALALCHRGDVPAGELIASQVVATHPHHPPTLRVLAFCSRARGFPRAADDLERKADFYERGVEPPGT